MDSTWLLKSKKTRIEIQWVLWGCRLSWRVKIQENKDWNKIQWIATQTSRIRLKSKKTRIEIWKLSIDGLPYGIVKIQENKDWNSTNYRLLRFRHKFVKIQENKDWNRPSERGCDEKASVKIQENKDWNDDSLLFLRGGLRG